MYCEEICELFKNNFVTIPEPQPYDYKNKGQLLLTEIGGEWYKKKYDKNLLQLNIQD